jgi:hypothetical protein
MKFTVIDTKTGRQWVWYKLAEIDIKGRKMMNATFTTAFAQMIINNVRAKEHTIKV